MKTIRKIGVYTSGGDAPGMNAAIRAVVRMGIHQKLEVIGIKTGYSGMIDADFETLNLRSVANIIQRGGTFLKTGRSQEFLQPEVRKKAYANLQQAGIDAMVCIGGDGSFRGAHTLYKEFGMPIIGIPGTIDNDIIGTDFTIGFDTAVNTALDAIDRIRDTATSHNRLFIVEVMGRNSGFLALDVGIAGGAQEIFIPEQVTDINDVVHRLQESTKKGKLYSILVAAEGQKPGRAYDLCDNIRKKTGIDAKVCILGHIQRGGSPSARDRIIASALGAGAVDALLRGESDKMLGLLNGKLALTTFEEATSRRPTIRQDKLELAKILSV